MHITNVQFVFALFAVTNIVAYIVGRRHGRKAVGS